VEDIVWLAMAGMLVAGAVASAHADAAGLPPNVIAPDVLRPLLASMWHGSPSFRRQCARLAARPEVTVHIQLAVQVSGSRARSRVSSRGRATVYIAWRDPARYIEQIAHELEHVVEQLDGIDLPRLADDGVDGVMRHGADYETARAQSVGRAVAREVSVR
jgi:hypothetical protein